MGRRWTIGVALVGALALGACHVRAYRPYGTVVYQAPPPPRVMAVQTAAPGPGYAWVNGYWHWDGGQWVWMDGQWVAQRQGYVYVGPSWVQQGGGYVYQDGGYRQQPAGVYVTPPQGGVYVTPPQGGVYVNGGARGAVEVNSR